MRQRFSDLLGIICQAAATEGMPTDHELLGRFVRWRDENAFEELVRRYGPMVMSVCRTTLSDRHLAEDAFQAAFLTLACRASSVRQSQAIASWLHRVAIRISLNLQRSIRRERERQAKGARSEAVPPDEVVSPGETTRCDIEAALNEELGQLPDRYRQAIVLCCLLGKTFSQAGAELGLDASSVWRRVDRGREMLRQRLARRGMAVAGGVLLTSPVLGDVSSASVGSVARLALSATAGQTSEISARVMALVREAAPAGVKWKLWSVVVAIVLIGVATGYAALSGQALPPAVSERASSTPAPNEPLRAAPVAVLAGVVRDNATRPVPFARVVVFAKHRERGEGGAGDRVLAEVQADANGHYTLPVPPFPAPQLEDRRVKLFATAPNGKAIAVHEVAIPPGRVAPAIDLTLATARDLEGVVTDLRGEPVVGAKVSVIGLGNVTVSFAAGAVQEQPTANWPEPVVTDTRGRFTIPAVAEIKVKIAVDHDTHAYSELWVAAAGANSEPTLIRLGPPRRLEGQVLAADTGTPFSHARVLVTCPNSDGVVGRNVLADAEGRFSVNLPDRQLIRVQAHTIGESPYLPVMHSLNWSDSNQTKRDVKLVLPRGVLVRGRVVEESGFPVAGAHVQFFPRHKDNPHYRPEVGSGGAATFLVDEDGRFTVPILPGPGTLLVSGPSLEYLPQETDLQMLISGRASGSVIYPHAAVALNMNPHDPAPTPTITLRRGAVIEGKLLTPDGKPLANGRLLCRHLVIPRDLSRPIAVSVTNGRFRLPGCVAGRRYFTLFTDAEHRWGAAAELTVPAPNTEPVVVRLEPTIQTELRFITSEGKPAAGASPSMAFLLPPDASLDEEFRQADPLLVSWYRGSGAEPGPISDSSGRAFLNGLVPGVKYRVGKSTGTRWQPLLEFEPKSGEPLRLPTIVAETDHR